MTRALVIEGGSMRAAYANGVLAAFEEAGYHDFDAVYGTSAGGALAAWWSARQARFAAETWKYVQDRRILSYRRWLLGRGALLDHDALFRIVYQAEMPLDVATLKRAPHPVIVTVTDVPTGQTLYPDIRFGDTLAWVRASGRLPLATGPPVEIDGRKFLDGGITDPIPIGRALEDGHKEIVLVLNRPDGDRRPEPEAVTRIVARRFPQLEAAVRDHHGLHNRAVALARNPPAGVRVRIIRPARDLGVGRLTRDHARVQGAVAAGRADGEAFLAAGSMS